MLRIPPRYTNTNQRFSGGYGEVLILHDSFLDRSVALKSIKNIIDRDQLLSEVIALSEIRSKHALQIYDLILDEVGVLGIIEEYIPGDDLTLRFTKHSYKSIDFMRLAHQIACGISDIHTHDIVHRDIKLNNMKFDSEGIIKLFDFGLSCVHDKYVTVASRGTMVYRAPELYSPPLKIEKAIDVYAFGICCWLLITDGLPGELLEIPPQQSARAPSISTVASDLPEDVVNILDRTLSPDPADRPDMTQVRDIISQQLLFGKHRAWVTGGYELHTAGQAVSIGSDTSGKIVIGYDGLRFFVRSIMGDIYVNNLPLSINMELPGSSVITIGAPHLGPNRTFLEFNISHPVFVL